MKKVALIFVAAILIPAIGLAWLAALAGRDQELILQTQEAQVCQVAADSIVARIAEEMGRQQRSFAAAVDRLLAETEPRQLASGFDSKLRQSWDLAQLGFSLALNGDVLNPLPWDSEQAKRFRLENDLFLCSRETVDVVWRSPRGKINLGQLQDSKSSESKSIFATKGMAASEEASATEATQFKKMVGQSREGTLARFLQDHLNLLFWYRSARDTNIVFGAQIKLPGLIEKLRPSLALNPILEKTFVAALRDDTGRVVALSHGQSLGTSKEPFLRRQVGEVLPHWEISLHAWDPGRFRNSAALTRWTIGLLVVTLLSAIGVGGWLVFSDLRRELITARQKTDFVSNVSHELKTPLTSIRMFSEMLLEAKHLTGGKQQEYLRIISTEAARLTRLINNVLAFSRAETGEVKYLFEDFDLREMVRQTMETYRPHLESNGFAVQILVPEGPVLVRGDRDALSQVLLNLLSNAEKYALDGKSVEVILASENKDVCLTVCDRGAGVAKGQEEKIFEKFFRAHDSLANGIPGTGLGLTLGRQIARAHHGELLFKSREGGGSCFILKLPEAKHA
jgi:signal transduction histidine kinase